MFIIFDFANLQKTYYLLFNKFKIASFQFLFLGFVRSVKLRKHYLSTTGRRSNPQTYHP